MTIPDRLAKLADVAAELEREASITAVMARYEGTNNGRCIRPEGFNLHWTRTHQLLLEMDEFVRIAKRGEQKVKEYELQFE